jgi:hypothetical protein
MRKIIILLLTLFALPLAASDAEAPSPPAQATPRPSGAGPTQLFQVILLRAATTGSEELTGLPKNAEKAVRDVRDFLPFKSYKLLDSALLRVQDGGSARLDGIPPQQYQVRINFKPLANNRLSVWDFNVTAIPQRNGTPLPRGVAPEAERAIIDTSFTIDLGETIVVGSSKLGGNEAVVVLLTALPR